MTEEFCLLHCWKSVVENSSSYSGCGWVAVPIHGRSCPVSSPPFLAVHPHAPQGRSALPPAMGGALVRVFWPVSVKLNQIKPFPLSVLLIQLTWTEIQEPPSANPRDASWQRGGMRHWHLLFQTDCTHCFPWASGIQVKMHGCGLITATAVFKPASPFQTPCYSIAQQ